ncbi:MAG TPA: hypothetical protein VHN16_15740 [Streptosporangiaceae bacterium]|nr:hypothetical protein [Streptosporangiaceae bacterium]
MRRHQRPEHVHIEIAADRRGGIAVDGVTIMIGAQASFRILPRAGVRSR